MKVKNIILCFFLIIAFQCKKDPIDKTEINSNNSDSLNISDTIDITDIIDIIDTIINEIDSILFYNEYIIAGDSVTYKYFNIDSLLENISGGDSVPRPIWESSSHSTSINSPLNIDDDEIIDIRYGCYDFYRNAYSISKAFFVANNYGNEKDIEFAVEKDEILNLNSYEKMIHLFNSDEIIDSSFNWVSSNNSDYYISLLNRHEPYFNDYSGKNESINGNINDMYIGIRRKINDDYIYGWIKITVINHDLLIIKGSSQSYWYEIKD